MHANFGVDTAENEILKVCQQFANSFLKKLEKNVGDGPHLLFLRVTRAVFPTSRGSNILPTTFENQKKK